MNNSILENLNEEQRKAVLQKDGPVLIIAGAGSGKTRVLTSKIALLLEEGVHPENILAITFTKKAAGVMKDRVRMMVGDLSRGLSIGTFHSVFAQLLRIYHETIKFPSDFTIYDESDTESCLRTCVGEVLYGPEWNNKELNKFLTDEQKAERKQAFKTYKASDIRSMISLAKNNLILPKAYNEDPAIKLKDSRHNRPKLGEIYTLYMKKCRKAGAMDFDDILVYMHYMLSSFDWIREALAQRFQYILVDEYQDTNAIQNEIVTMLASVHRNICVVGDDSQSIYAFRGARIENILNFKEEYPELKMFRLVTNYRSTSQIVDAANKLISHNEMRLEKTCVTGRGRGEDISYETLPDDREEARFIVDYIRDAVRCDNGRYADFAVLYRTNAQARALEDAMMKAHLPYIVYSSVSFFERAEVKDALAYFRLCVNPNDDEAFKRICNRPARGISEATLSALGAAAAHREKSLFETAASGTAEELGIKPKAFEALRAFTLMIEEQNKAAKDTDALKAAQGIYEATGIYDLYLKEEGEDGQKRSENLNELINSITYFINDRKKEYEYDLPEGPLEIGLQHYLQDVALLSNADTAKDGQADSVSLMTSHCSKGLEFRTVFLVGCEEGLYPLLRDDKPFDLEEERRLFYVSVTRAKDRLVLTSCTQRWKYGQIESCKPSRFMPEMGLEIDVEEEQGDIPDEFWY